MVNDMIEASLKQIELMGTACSHTSTMNQLYSGRVPRCLSSAITVVPALSDVSFPSFPEQGSSYGEREQPISSVTSFGTSMDAHDSMSTCMLASNFTLDLHANNESSNGKLCSGPYVPEPSADSRLSSTHSSLLGNSRPLMMDFPEVSEHICLNQERLLGLFDYPASVDFSNTQNVTTFGQQVQETITTVPNTHAARQNEWFSSGSLMRLPKNVCSAESVLKVSGYNNVLLIPWPIPTPRSYPYSHTQGIPNPLHCGELCADNLPSSNAAPKSRMRWTPELHERFVDAVNKLGGSESRSNSKSSPEGYESRRINYIPCKKPSAGASGQGSSQTDEVSTLQFKGTGNVEGLMAQIGLQKQLHEQLEIQRKLQLQVEEHSKYLEIIIAKQSESLKKLGALPGFRDRFRQVFGDKKEGEEQTVCTHSAEER
ncbi:hypothetical protein HU200_041640 [Digitaria exilis]|uniref:MYB-CC type transcription factor LHEQLE-containing domain-containing protein n=1 Tax=Digitaria exilis TaxID=1010633 RepID=A0A835B7I3_9POAL|nr:hypothetical protein HU200_041640 [Digitaria exilis]